MVGSAILTHRRTRIYIVLALWLAAAALIAVQAFVLKAVVAENIASAQGHGAVFRVPADWWRVTGVMLPVACIVIALWLQRRWMSGWARKLSGIALLLLVPLALMAILIASVRGPVMLDSVRLPSGKRYVLAAEPIPTDSVYTLYEAVGRFGLWWRLVTYLDYSEDGRFVGGERIALSHDAKWLTVARAGIWTDCFRLVNGEPISCPIDVSPMWYDATYEQDMKARSAEIQRLTGMKAPR